MKTLTVPDNRSLWFVTVTLAGAAVSPSEIQGALERLSHEHPFLLSGRYTEDRAEIRYWEEAPDASCAAGLALRLWDEHRDSASLPDWAVVGVEIVDRETFHRRGRVSGHGPGLVAAGGVSPL
ncbi:MAG: hypothetical protein FJW80_05935 [Actinobacteria bacterium]|nr:hypothetical protein [Actinomycetota bacterium]